MSRQDAREMFTLRGREHVVDLRPIYMMPKIIQLGLCVVMTAINDSIVSAFTCSLFEVIIFNCINHLTERAPYSSPFTRSGTHVIADILRTFPTTRKLASPTISSQRMMNSCRKRYTCSSLRAAQESYWAAPTEEKPKSSQASNANVRTTPFPPLNSHTLQCPVIIVLLPKDETHRGHTVFASTRAHVTSRDGEIIPTTLPRLSRSNSAAISPHTFMIGRRNATEAYE